MAIPKVIAGSEMKVAIYLFLFLSTFAHGADISKNGAWWASLSEMSRTYYLVGYINGAANASIRSPATICLKIFKNYNRGLEGCMNDVSAVVDKELISPLSNKPYSQFIEGVNVFYKDYRNKSICIGTAVNFVTEEINGMSKQKADEWVEMARSYAGKSNCD